MRATFAITDAANYPSVAVMERLGMLFDRRFRHHGLDSVRYSINRAAFHPVDEQYTVLYAGEDDSRGSAMAAPANLRIIFDPDPSAAARDTVERGVDQHNVAATNQPDYYPLAFLLKDEAHEVLGGLLGDVWGGWLHVGYLWVARPLRRHGWARRLMEEAERYASQRGAHHAYLETFSFQARPFYEKLGYEVFGQLEDFPPGHTKYFLRKALRERRGAERMKDT